MTSPNPTEAYAATLPEELAILDAEARFDARSWLFAPADSERKMEKAAAGSADAVIFDIEDAVAEAEKPKARAMAAEFIHAHGDIASKLWVRINPLQGPHALADLAAVVAAGPGGIMLPKANGRADAELLDHYLTALEVAGGIAPGSTKVMVLAIETAAGMFTAGSYLGAPRVVAMSWGGEDLSVELGASGNRQPDGSYEFTYELARSLCLAGACASGLAPIETIHGDFKDEAGLAARAAKVRRAGFRGMLAIHPAQVEVINEAFTPSPEEQAAAREIVELFAANPDAGVISHKGNMLDRPHLARAKATLALAGRG